ncbi:zinc finger protein, putative [Plasmodium gallinaceum]|uniref:Zinc finger protein, putative n=1 Tax=Plasmodium gallinaceum TaxID=5849 RepID=A0A1J1GPF4_PLAGA|nr:zinc finger protein, putative [Plasmodium gallinaceum]CRG94301.1 zinc finger protein, putative [Plasmodium gallinaceum]
MNTFINNGNYRNRTLNVSKCLNINYKINSIQHSSSIFCPICNIPFNSKIRINPCYHIICNKCYDLSVLQQSCLICNSYINDVDYIFIKDKIYICPFNDCKKGYLNEKSFNYHIYFKHEFLKEKKKICEKSSSSSISDIQNIKEEISPKKEIFKNNFFNFGKNSQNKEDNKYPNIRENEKELIYEYNKNDMNLEFLKKNNINKNIDANYTDSSKTSPFSDLKKQNPIQENTFNLNNLIINNKSLDNQNLINKNIMNNNKNISKFANVMQIPDKWNYANVPFKSDYNTFNFSCNENSSINQNSQSKKNNQDDDYDNLEDLM